MRPYLSLAFAAMVAALVLAGCAGSAPAPTAAPAPKPAAPTTAPAAAPTKAAAPAAAPTKAAEPTKPAAAPAPTAAAAPAKKVDWPEKGRPITILVPYAAGGGNDIPARMLAPLMEKILGTPVQVVNRAGGGSQVGLNELVQAKPDGYTIGYTPQPAGIMIYIDAERKATFTRKSFAPVALDNVDTGAIVVKADSPYKTIKDLIDAAKANPNGLKSGTEGVMGTDHFGTYLFEKLTGTKFTLVHFDGAAPANTALAGGHVDVRFSKTGSTSTLLRGGQARAIAIMDKDRSPLYPDVPTLEQQGFKLYWSPVRGVSAPAGTPKEIVDILADTIKKAHEDSDRKQKLSDLGFTSKFLSPEEFGALWDDLEKTSKPLFDEIKAELAKK